VRRLERREPASLAGASLRVTVDRLAELLAEFEAAAGAERELLGTATDPETVAAELAAVRAEALKTVADAEVSLAGERQVRLTAEDAAAEMQAELEHARAGAAEARDEAAAATEQAAQQARRAQASDERAASPRPCGRPWRTAPPGCRSPGRSCRPPGGTGIRSGRTTPGRRPAGRDAARPRPPAQGHRSHSACPVVDR